MGARGRGPRARQALRDWAPLALATSVTAAVNGLALALDGFSDAAMLYTTASGLLAFAFLLTAAG